MELQIENGKKIRIAATGLSDYLSREEVTNIVGAMFDIVNMVHSYENMECKKTVAPEQVESTKKEIVKSVTEAAKETSQAERSLIRPRIPNNIVDVKDLSIEKAVTENALVRCPHCGQAHCLVVPSNGRMYMMRRSYFENEFGVIADFNALDNQDLLDACCKEDTDRQAYYNDLQSIPFREDTDFVVDNETEIFCPVCCVSHAFAAWKDAYENPLKYFETEHICDACGGEKLEKLIKDHKVYQCDKCGLQTDFKEES